ncbi:MAG: NAD-dependent epimerase/dehydratase family protein [Rhodanobacteraceae bacterium]|nr:NAD-dependent epimerase/dehydratase family protein [Rhodanobacteraceae bacterium]
MAKLYRELFDSQRKTSRLREESWLVSGAAGFIGSHLCEALLAIGCKVTGLYNFSTGKPQNLTKIRASVGEELFQNFSFIEGDVRNIETCRQACRKCTVVLHQAALGSVPRSLEHPEWSTETNIGGFVNILTAAKDATVRRFVYASSSSVYGDEATLPKVEERVGRVLSPYALTKRVNEQFATLFTSCFGFESVGLRYFNVFGPRQDPLGAYAAVVPRWITSVLNGSPIIVNGDGETSRDFCFVSNVVLANVLAAISPSGTATDRVYNVACEEATTLNQLLKKIIIAINDVSPKPERRVLTKHVAFREGDIRHSLADISRARELLNYHPVSTIDEGLALTVPYYVEELEAVAA